MKRALITGITGQDGGMLAAFLILKGYHVVGMLPHRNQQNFDQLKRLGILEHEQLRLAYGDLLDAESLRRAVDQAEPDEIYNLGAQSFVKRSWTMPTYTHAVTGLGAINMMEAAYQSNPTIRFYQASTSEMFGCGAEPPQNELTAMNPTNPYAIAKLTAHLHARALRDSRDQFIACGILFNHESEFRAEHFVTQKIAKGAVRIFQSLQHKLKLGNLDAMRDWGYAGDYVRAMWMMLQREAAEDFVIGTGKAHSVRDFCKLAFKRVGLVWEDHVETAAEFCRPNDEAHLCADITKAEEVLKWSPQTSFNDLVNCMVDRWLDDGRPEVSAERANA